MIYKDLIRMLSITVDGNKNIIWSDGNEYKNIKIQITDNEIIILPNRSKTYKLVQEESK